jgi:hypothetical protein
MKIRTSDPNGCWSNVTTNADTASTKDGKKLTISDVSEMLLVIVLFL